MFFTTWIVRTAVVFWKFFSARKHWQKIANRTVNTMRTPSSRKLSHAHKHRENDAF